METSKPFISIVLLNWNGVESLKQTMPSILSLPYSNREVLVVDNNSTDASVNFLESLSAVRVVKLEKNIGYSAGKNIGVIQARGEYVLLIDNDILLHPEIQLERLIDACDAETAFLQIPLLDSGKTETGYYGIFFSLYGINSHKKDIEIATIMRMKEAKIPIGGGTGGSLFFRKSTWEKIGGLDESQFFNVDDVDIGPRAWIFGYKIFLYTKTYFTHIGTSNADTAAKYSFRYKLLFSGHARSMIKNYRLKNLIIRFPLFCFFQLAKTIKYTFKKQNISVFMAFLSSIRIFIHNFRDTLIERKEVQLKRIVSKDIFLEIKPPIFL